VSGSIAEEDRLLNLEDTAALLGVQPRTVRAWVAAGKLPHYRVGWLLKFKRDELEAWLAKRHSAGSS
jgi:excisionase family DNA binding protein